MPMKSRLYGSDGNSPMAEESGNEISASFLIRWIFCGVGESESCVCCFPQSTARGVFIIVVRAVSTRVERSEIRHRSVSHYSLRRDRDEAPKAAKRDCSSRILRTVSYDSVQFGLARTLPRQKSRTICPFETNDSKRTIRSERLEGSHLKRATWSERASLTTIPPLRKARAVIHKSPIWN